MFFLECPTQQKTFLETGIERQTTSTHQLPHLFHGIVICLVGVHVVVHVSHPIIIFVVCSVLGLVILLASRTSWHLDIEAKTNRLYLKLLYPWPVSQLANCSYGQTQIVLGAATLLASSSTGICAWKQTQGTCHTPGQKHLSIEAKIHTQTFSLQSLLMPTSICGSFKKVRSPRKSFYSDHKEHIYLTIKFELFHPLYISHRSLTHQNFYSETFEYFCISQCIFSIGCSNCSSAIPLHTIQLVPKILQNTKLFQTWLVKVSQSNCSEKIGLVHPTQ